MLRTVTPTCIHDLVVCQAKSVDLLQKTAIGFTAEPVPFSITKGAITS